MVRLIESYAGQIIAPFLAALVTAILVGFEEDFVDDLDKELLVFFIPIVSNILAYSIPAVLTVLYFITGSDWLLVYWLDNVLIFFIEHWLSNYNVLIIIFTVIVLLRGYSNTNNTLSFIVMALLYGL